MLQDEREAIQLDGLSILERLLAEYPDAYGSQIVELIDRHLTSQHIGDTDDNL